MIKALCISDNWQTKPGYDPATTCPRFFEQVTIINKTKIDGEMFYQLNEHDGVFIHAAFVLQSDLDETTFARNYKKQIRK